jgi:hypothetical protein
MFGDSSIHSRHPSVVAACPNTGQRVTSHLPIVPQRMPDVACSSYISLTLSHLLVLFLLPSPPLPSPPLPPPFPSVLPGLSGLGTLIQLGWLASKLTGILVYLPSILPPLG